MWILRINMTDRSYRFEDVPKAYEHLGGRGLTSTMVYDEVEIARIARVAFESARRRRRLVTHVHMPTFSRSRSSG